MLRSRAQDIVFGLTGQSLLWDCPEGRPTTVDSVGVFRMDMPDDGAAEVATTGAAAIDSVNTTVSGNSGDGQTYPRRLWVTSTSGFVVGRQYKVTSASGLSEWIDIVEVVSGSYVTARYPLANAYVAADVVVGTRVTQGVLDSWAADKGKVSGGTSTIPGYRVRWAYTAGGVKYVHDQPFDLVRYAGGHTLTAVDVDREFPGLKGMLPTYHRADDALGLLDQAYEKLRWDLVAGDIQDSSVRDQDALNRATMLCLGVLLARSRVMQGADTGLLVMAKEDYQSFLTDVFRIGAKVAMEEDSTGAGVKTELPRFLVK